MPAAAAAKTIKIAAPTGGNWEKIAKISSGTGVTPALRKEAFSQAASFLSNPAALSKLTSTTPAKLAALAAKVAQPPTGAAETSKLMGEILALAEKAAAFLSSLEDGDAKAAQPAAKATKKPKAAGGLKANSKPAKEKAAGGAKKAIDVQAMIKELVAEAKADFAADAVQELAKAITSSTKPKKAAVKKAAPKAALKKAEKKVRAEGALCLVFFFFGLPALLHLSLTPTRNSSHPQLAPVLQVAKKAPAKK